MENRDQCERRRITSCRKDCRALAGFASFINCLDACRHEAVRACGFWQRLRRRVGV